MLIQWSPKTGQKIGRIVACATQYQPIVKRVLAGISYMHSQGNLAVRYIVSQLCCGCCKTIEKAKYANSHH